MKKRIQALVLLAAMLLSLIGCESEEAPPDPNREYTDEEILSMYDEYGKHYLYWVELPTGEIDDDGKPEFEYVNTEMYDLTNIHNHNIGQTFITLDQRLVIPVNHYESGRTYHDVTDTRNGSIYRQIDGVTQTLMFLSPKTLEYELYDVEMTIEELKGVTEEKYNQYLAQNIEIDSAAPQLLSIMPTLDGGITAFYRSRKSAIEPDLELLKSNDMAAIQKYDEMNRNANYRFSCWNADGERVFTYDYNTFPYGIPRSDYVVAQNGNIYFDASSYVGVMSASGEQLYTIEYPDALVGNYYVEVSLDANGNAQITYPQDNMDVTIYYRVPINDKEKCFDQPIKMPDFPNVDIQFAPGFDYYYITMQGIYGINTNSDAICLVNWSEYGLAYENIIDVHILSADCIYIIVKDIIYGDYKIGYLTQTPVEGRTPHKINWDNHTLKVAYVGGHEALKTIDKYASRYNVEGNAYYAQLISYTDQGTRSASDMLIRDMLTGSSPDIIIFDEDMPADPFAKLGAFVDLYELIDKDNEYSRDSFLPCVLEPFTNEKGELPYLMTNFMLLSLSGRTELVGDVDSITDIADIAASLDDDTALFNFYTSSKKSDAQLMLEELLPNMLNQYVDYDKAVCNFDDTFAELLRLCLEAPVSRDGITAWETYQENRAVLRTMDSKLFSSYLDNRYIYYKGDDVSFLGYPTDGYSGAVIVPLMSFGITKQSKYTEGAWHFIKSCIEYQNEFWADANSEGPGGERLDAKDGFPCTKTALDNMLEGLYDYYFFRRYYIFESTPNKPKYAVVSTPLRRFTEEELTLNENWADADDLADTRNYIYYFTQTDEAAIRKLIDTARIVRSYDDDLLSIIYEDASYYFAGTKSLEETVKIINKRVQTRLSE